mgnify:CR=1 FL=1
MRADIDAAVSAARTKYTVRKAPKGDVIESVVAHDEHVLQVLFGLSGSKAVTLVLTDRCIYKLTHSNLTGKLGAGNEVIPFAQLTGVERGRVPMGEFRVMLTRAHNIDDIVHLDERESEAFVAAVRDRMQAAQTPTVTVVKAEVPLDPLDQLRKLKELHEAGVVTDAEYEEKRADLISRI